MPDISAIVESAQSGEWVACVGLIILGLVWVFRTFVKPSISKQALPWIALALGPVVYIATSFASGEVSWLEALGNGLFASGEAALLWSAIFKHISKKLPFVSALFICLFLVFGCAERKAQISVQTGLNAMAESIASSSEVVSVGIAENHAKVSQETDDWCRELGFHPRSCPGAFDKAYGEMEPWYKAADALKIASKSVRLGQDILDTWVASGQLPENGWTEFCEEAGQGFESLAELLVECGVEVPSKVVDAVGPAKSMCVIAGGFVNAP